MNGEGNGVIWFEIVNVGPYYDGQDENADQN